MKLQPRKLLPAAALLLIAATAGYYAWTRLHDTGPGDGFASGNGRIEATQIDVATKLAGRVDSIFVHEGDFVKAGQPLAKMDVNTLDAQLDEAQARQRGAVNSAASVEQLIAQRESDVVAAQAVVTQREAELDAAQRKLARSETLSREGASSMQELDDDRARMRSADATVRAAKAQVAAAKAAVDATRAQLVAARSDVAAARATVARVNADIDDSQLTAPRDGRVQYRVAEPGEVLAAGGTVLNMVDLSDVYMTFFLPETVAGKVAMGAEVRLIVDAAPNWVIPATVTFVASTAQFTPKTVETTSEREKLMFRVKAQISRTLLLKHLELVKTGVPGVAWVKIDPKAAWPAKLAVNVPQ
ncbi:HlyD family secretion protein [Paraburkholderia kururiensis]|uniref:Efflux RND transporter periplasmic adaptor subunit n=1 Tax=Paraburkholderia kururiensis TaxID=984307 RepID=A0ABZ0WP89_9BURK|nr:efflux RND transporter periplasmic adaptor subunit [Paraburkholderia kururiensis]WQD79172.1 efflux RND transporter periplasmic adaptor subunit [Paraburkholderia kururiensis]